jgi:hypothetical protein
MHLSLTRTPLDQARRRSVCLCSLAKPRRWLLVRVFKTHPSARRPSNFRTGDRERVPTPRGYPGATPANRNAWGWPWARLSTAQQKLAATCACMLLPFSFYVSRKIGSVGPAARGHGAVIPGDGAILWAMEARRKCPCPGAPWRAPPGAIAGHVADPVRKLEVAACAAARPWTG